MDKRTRAGVSKLKVLHFLPLISLDVQDPGLQAALKREGMNPAAALFVGTVPGIGESMVSLAEVWGLPSSYLGTELRVPDDSTAGPNDMYLYPTRNDSRLGTLTKDRQDLLCTKLAAFWARISTP
ncbi:hypothetical protein [Micromonospora sp. NPDC047730]|uniref:hypothetical protein n=1 Tax=Micromonospora sp. NPDC047730 TaxID=3364253 RepID=UPI0037236D06